MAKRGCKRKGQRGRVHINKANSVRRLRKQLREGTENLKR